MLYIYRNMDTIRAWWCFGAVTIRTILRIRSSITSTISGYDVMTWKHFRVTDPLWGETTGDQWIPLTKNHAVARSFDIFVNASYGVSFVGSNRGIGGTYCIYIT